MTSKKIKTVWFFHPFNIKGKEKSNFEKKIKDGVLCQEKDILIEICRITKTKTNLLGFGTINLFRKKYPDIIVFIESNDNDIVNIIKVIKMFTKNDFIVLIKEKYGAKNNYSALKITSYFEVAKFLTIVK